MFAFKADMNRHTKNCKGIFKSRVESSHSPKSVNCNILKNEYGKCNGIRKRNKIKEVEYKEIIDDNEIKKFQCNKCEKVFDKMGSIIQRIYIVHREKKLKCEKCIKMFALKSIMKKHVEKCDGILRTTISMKSREINYKIITLDKERKFQCMKCQETFTDRIEFHKHFRIHKEKKFKCDMCSKMFVYKSFQENHTKLCNENLKTKTFTKSMIKGVEYREPFDENGKKIRTMSREVNYKIILDSESKSFQCNLCKELFSTRTKFHVHFRNHWERKYKCEKCSKMFPYKSWQENHTKICNGILKTKTFSKSKIKDVEYKETFDENGRKQFQCCKCEKIFDKNVTVSHHIYEIHREKKFKCDKCNKVFTFKTDMNRHIQKCNGMLKSRKRLGRTCGPKSTNYNILKSELGKTFQCISCQKIFSKLGTFHSHYYMNHRDKCFKCDKCHETFPYQSFLNNHMKKCDGIVKTKEVKPTYKVFVDWDAQKKYQCDLCDKTFTDLDTFHQHFFEVHNTSSSKNRLKDVKYKEMFDNDGKKKYQCLQCEKTYSASSLVLQHIYQVHREKKHKCEICNRSFTFLSKLKNHLEHCSGSNDKEPESELKEEHFMASKVEVENTISTKEFDSTEKDS